MGPKGHSLPVQCTWLWKPTNQPTIQNRKRTEPRVRGIEINDWMEKVEIPISQASISTGPLLAWRGLSPIATSSLLPQGLRLDHFTWPAYNFTHPKERRGPPSAGKSISCLLTTARERLAYAPLRSAVPSVIFFWQAQWPVWELGPANC